MLRNVGKTNVKLVLTILSFVLAFSFAFSPSGHVSAAQVDVEAIQGTKEFQKKQAAVEKLIVFKDGRYQIDPNSVQNGELTTSEINRINEFFNNIEPAVLEKINKEILFSQEGDIQLAALPVVVVAFLGTLAAFVGWQLAAKITSDFYTWGVKSACKKWKKTESRKKFL